jgi:hypothetical protein
MPLAQVLQFDQRQAMGRQRKVQPGSKCVILQLFRAPMHRTDVSTGAMSLLDDDRAAGRGRDPG